MRRPRSYFLDKSPPRSFSSLQHQDMAETINMCNLKLRQTGYIVGAT